MVEIQNGQVSSKMTNFRRLLAREFVLYSESIFDLEQRVHDVRVFHSVGFKAEFNADAKGAILFSLTVHDDRINFM